MARIYKTAMGNRIDIEALIAKNEKVIAVGNKKVNARGDQLGPGGKIVKTRDQIMKEYYAATNSSDGVIAPPPNSGLSDKDNT